MRFSASNDLILTRAGTVTGTESWTADPVKPGASSPSVSGHAAEAAVMMTGPSGHARHTTGLRGKGKTKLFENKLSLDFWKSKSKINYKYFFPTCIE